MTDIGTISGGIEIDTRKAFDPITRLYDLLDKFAATSIPKTVDANAKLQSGLDRLAASLDPVVAGEQKLERAHHTLDAALKQNIITQEKYNELLGKAKEKYESAGQGSSLFSQLIGKLGSVTGEGGELVAKLTEHVAGLGEKLEKLGKDGESATGALGAMLSGLADFIPLLLAAAAAAVVFGAAWVSFDFLKEAVIEGAKTEEVIAQLNNSLINNGAAAGLSAAKLVEQAEALALSTGQSKEAIIAGETLMTRFGKMTSETFPQFRQAAINFAITTKTDLVGSFETLARASEDSGRGMMALKAVGVVLNAQQKAHMKDLVDNGHVVEYQNELLGLLATKIGGAADAYANTFSGGIARAKQHGVEFKESIASEIIPALEFLFDDLVKSAGGWEAIAYVVKYYGHEIGNAVREMVYGVLLYYHEWEYENDIAQVSFHNNMKKIADAAFDTAIFIAKAWQNLPEILGGGHTMDRPIFELLRYKQAADISFGSAAANAQDAANKELAAYDATGKALMSHKQALAGDEKLQKNRGDVVDKIARKTKEAASALDDWDKIVRAFNNHIDDQNTKLDEQIREQEALQRALAKGLEAYGLEEQQQKRNAAVFAIVSKADQEYRSEVEKLTAAIDKLHKAHNTKDEAEKSKQLDVLKASYEDVRASLSAKAAAEVDAKSKTAELLTQSKEISASEQLRAKWEAEIADALNSTTDATDAAGKALAVYQAGVKASLTLDDEGIRKAKERAAADYDLTRQDEKLLAVAKEYGRLESQVNIGNLQAHIDINLSERLQAIQAAYLEKLTAGGERTVEQGIELFRKLAGGNEDVLKKFLAVMQDDIGALYDQAQAKQISGISKTPLDRYREQQSEYQRLLDAGMSSEADAHKAMFDNSQKFWSDQISTWKAAIDSLAKIGGKVGSIFSAIGQALNTIQSAQQTSANVSSAFSGMGASSGMSSSAGGIAAVVQIFMEIYGAVSAHLDKLHAQSYGAGNTTFNITGGDVSTSYLDGTGQKVINEIKKLVKQFGDSLGGTITDLDQIGVRIRNDGKYVESWVKDQFIGHFATVDEAIQAALEYELQSGAIKFKGISDLIAQGMKAFTEPNYEAEVQFLDQLKQIDNLSKSQGQTSLESTIHGLQDLFDALTKMKDVTPAVVKGFDNISTAEDNAWQQWRDSITGRTQSAAELLKIKQQEGEMFNAERQMRLADLALRKMDLEQTLLMLKAKAGMLVPGREGRGSEENPNPVNGGGDGNGTPTKIASIYGLEAAAFAAYTNAMAEISQADIKIKSAYVKAQADLLPTQASIYDAQIAMVIAQIEAIEKIIANMPSAIDIPSIRIPGGGGVGTGGKSEKQQFIDQLHDIVSQGLGPASKALYDYQKQLADLAEQQKKDKAPIEEYKRALAELDREFKTGLLNTAKGYAGRGDGFTQKLSGGLDYFHELETLGRKKTGIPDWLVRLLKGEFLEGMKKDWESRVDDFRGMPNPMSKITSDAKILSDELDALAAATGMTADQVKAAKDEIAQGAEYQRHNAVNGILDTLFGYLQNDVSYAGKAAELKKEELRIQFTLYEFQLKALNAWTDATAQLFLDAENAALAAADASDSANQAAQAAASISQPSDDPWALLKSYTDQALDPLTLQLQKINTDFSFIRLYLGNTAAVWQAETNAIHAAFKQAENGLDKFYDSLNQGQASGLTIDQQYQAAKATYDKVLSEIQHGDYTHIGELTGDSQALVALMAQEFDTSTQGYADMRAKILAELGPILKLAGIEPPPILGTVGSSAGSTGNPLVGSAAIMATASSNMSNSLAQIGSNQVIIASAAQSLAMSAESIRQMLAGNQQPQQLRYNQA